MADALKFVLELVDRMSGPANKAAKAVAGLNAALAGQAVPGGGSASRNAEKQMAAMGSAAEKASAKAAAAYDKARARAQPHEDAATLPMLAGMPKLRLANGELEQLKNKLREDKLAVTNLSASLRQLEQASHQDIGTSRLLRAELQARKNSLAQIQQKLVLSGNAAKFGSEGTNRLTTTLRELAEAAGGQGITGLAARLQNTAVQASQFSDSFKGVSSGLAEATGLGKGAATGITAIGVASVAAVGAVLALGAGLVGLTWHFAGVALEANEAKNDTMDMLEAMLGGADAANELAGDMAQIASVTSVSRGRIKDLAVEMSAAEVPTNLLADSIRAIAQAESVLPSAGGKLQKLIEKAGQTGKFQFSSKQLVGTGVQVQKLYEQIAKQTGKGVKQIEAEIKAGKIAADVGISALNKVITDKFGEVAEKQVLDFSTQITRFHENIARLFKDVNPEPFLKAMRGLLGIVDQNTAAGRALHVVLTATFDGIFKLVAQLVPYLETALKGVAIIGLKVAIAMLPLLDQLGLIGDEANGAAPGLDALSTFMSMVGDAAAFAVRGVTALITAVQKLNKLSGESVGTALAEKITGKQAPKTTAAARGIGGLLVTGLKVGIEANAPVLYNAVSALSTGVLGSFRTAWDMHSPSRKTELFGKHLDMGLAIGIRKNAQPANDNMMRLLSPPAIPSQGVGGLAVRPQQSAQSNQRSPSQSAPITVKIESGAIQINGVQNAEQLVAMLPAVMADVMEQAAQMAGLRGAA